MIGFFLLFFFELRVSPGHQRAAAVGVSVQDCSPGEVQLTPTLHLGQESTHLLPNKGRQFMKLKI